MELHEQPTKGREIVKEFFFRFITKLPTQYLVINVCILVVDYWYNYTLRKSFRGLS